MSILASLLVLTTLAEASVPMFTRPRDQSEQGDPVPTDRFDADLVVLGSVVSSRRIPLQDVEGVEPVTEGGRPVDLGVTGMFTVLRVDEVLVARPGVHKPPPGSEVLIHITPQATPLSRPGSPRAVVRLSSSDGWKQTVEPPLRFLIPKGEDCLYWVDSQSATAVVHEVLKPWDGCETAKAVTSRQPVHRVDAEKGPVLGHDKACEQTMDFEHYVDAVRESGHSPTPAKKSDGWL